MTTAATNWVKALRAASGADRPVIAAQALHCWHSTRPSGLPRLMVDILENRVAGIPQRHITEIAQLLTDQQVRAVLKQLPPTRLPHGTDALFHTQDPAAFLDVIADVRDGALHLTGVTSHIDSSLRRALRVASSSSRDYDAPLMFKDADEFMLIVGASAHPKTFLLPNISYSFHYQRADHFSRFAFANPHLNADDVRQLLRHSHPALIAQAHAEGLVPPALLTERVTTVINQGSHSDVMLLLAASRVDKAHVALAQGVLSQSAALRRTALSSAIPLVVRAATAVIAEHVPRRYLRLATTLAAASELELDELAMLARAVAGAPGQIGHVPAS